MARPVCQPGTFERLEIAPARLVDVFGQLVISTYDTDRALRAAVCLAELTGVIFQLRRVGNRKGVLGFRKNTESQL